MAENSNILITVTADDSGAITKINKLGQEINTAGDASKSWIQQLGDLKKQLASVDPNSQQWAELALAYKELGGSSKVVSQSVEELQSKVSSFNDTGAETISGVEGLKSQLRTLQTEFDKVAASAPGGGRYKELAQQIADVKTKITEASQAVANEGVPAFEGFANSTAGVGEKLSSFDIKGVGDQLKASAENVKNFKFGSLTEGLKATTQGFGQLGKALITNPIFLLAQIVIGIVTNFDKLAEAIPAVGIAFKIIGDAVGYVKDLIVGFTDAIGLTSIAAGNAIDAAIDNRDRVNKELDNQRRTAVAEAKKTGKDIEEVNAGFQKKRIDDNQKLIDDINAQEKKGVKLTDKQLEARQKLIDENTEFAIAAAEKEAAAVEQARIDAAKAEEKRLADEAKAREEALARAKERAAQIKANEKEVTDAIAASREEQFQAGLTAEEKELRQVALKYNQLVEKAGKNRELQKQLREQELIEQQAITDRFFEESLAKAADDDAKKLEQDRASAAKANEERIAREDAQFALEQELYLKGLSANEARRQKAVQDLNAEYDAKLLIAKGNATLTADLEKQRNAELEKINKEYRDSQKEADDKAAREKLDNFMKASDAVTKTAQDGLATLSSLNELFAGKSERSQKQAFKRNKALQIGQATISTYQSATAAYASQVIPGDPTSVPRAIIAAAAAVAAGLANIAKIKATTFESPAPSGGGATGGGGGGELAATGVASTGAPQFNPLAGLNLNQPQQIQPAYVLSSDIASSMEARSKVQDLSRL